MSHRFSSSAWFKIALAAECHMVPLRLEGLMITTLMIMMMISMISVISHGQHLVLLLNGTRNMIKASFII